MARPDCKESKEDYEDVKGELNAGMSTKILVSHFADDDKESSLDEASYFSQSRVLRNSLIPSVTDPDAPLKQRVALLENAVGNQQQRDDVTFDNILALSKDSERLEAALNALVNEKTQKLENDLKRFKQEIHHRFDLQSAENKRLQASVATLKAENNNLKKELKQANEKLVFCAREMGFEEEEEPNSRPNTVM